MALSLDDLKKKRPPRVSLPNKSESNSVNASADLPVRKKLMPWDPVPSDETRTGNEAITENKVSTNQSSDTPVKAEPKIVASDSEQKEVVQTHSTTLASSEKSKNISAPIEINNGAGNKNDLTPIVQPKLDFDLNAPQSPVLNEKSTQGSGITFSKNDISERATPRSDTDLTQKEHRSDTNIAQINASKNDISALETIASATEKSHRSDTNNSVSKNLMPQRSDTDLTHNKVSNSNKSSLKNRSDTDVTQPTTNRSISTSYRSDTDLTQPSELVAKIIDQVKSPTARPEGSILTNRSDTEVTQPKKEPRSVSHLQEEVTQPRHRSNTEVTPYLTQKRHKEVTQISAYSEGDLVLRRILILRGNGLSVFNYCCSTLLQTGQNILQTSYEAVALQTSVNIGSIKTTLKRLRDDSLLNIESHGGGKGAIIDIIIDDSVLKVFARNLKNRSDTDVTQIDPQKRHRSDTNLDTNSSSKYVSINNNTIHTEKEPPLETQSEIWNELKEVDFSVLAQWNIRPSIVDTFRKNNWQISREDLEEQIERFVRYFTEVEYQTRRSSINSPYSFFLGCIKAIVKGEPNPIQDVKTQIELAQELAVKNKLMELEHRRREFEAIEKQLDQYRDSEFENWVSELSADQQASIIPPTKIAQVGSVSYRQLLKSYYTENIWPNYKQTFLNSL